jgi:hypothetical protein
MNKRDGRFSGLAAKRGALAYRIGSVLLCIFCAMAILEPHWTLPTASGHHLGLALGFAGVLLCLIGVILEVLGRVSEGEAAVKTRAAKLTGQDGGSA